MNSAVARFAASLQRRLDRVAKSALAQWAKGRDMHIVDRSYPSTRLLQDLLREWNPDNITVPDGFDTTGGLKVFDYAVRRR